ncbi:hypothetical protein GCM10012275_42720 [Longimycelium tulufanense]|uniref:Uncharacterized protein n=1 Tax=Longimycelium tulufanense TaxID=907463 RepID=A0A8J3FVZ4_9PSEU|nr:hypothetical protein [Longimycelium tulufanense]GGM67608.1 hypothetical protein GCM10012275_42720 [Longimycelium tulufanense]
MSCHEDPQPVPNCTAQAGTPAAGQEPTPLYAETAAALATSDDKPDDLDSWLEQYANPVDPDPMLDPDTFEGGAILRLFRRLKNVEEPDGSWSGATVVEELTSWFQDLGFDLSEHPMDAGRRLRLALRQQPGRQLTSKLYGARIGTDHDNPESIIRSVLRGLVVALGPGTGIDLVSYGGEVLGRFEQPPTVH